MNREIPNDNIEISSGKQILVFSNWKIMFLSNQMDMSLQMCMPTVGRLWKDTEWLTSSYPVSLILKPTECLQPTLRAQLTSRNPQSTFLAPGRYIMVMTMALSWNSVTIMDIWGTLVLKESLGMAVHTLLFFTTPPQTKKKHFFLERSRDWEWSLEGMLSLHPEQVRYFQQVTHISLPYC